MKTGGRKATILVVEDDQHLLEGIRDILELDGYNVQIAQNGVEALAVLQGQSGPPDLIVSDIMMPQMDGVELFKTVRQQPQWLNIPFIFLTAKGERNDIYKGLRLGVDDYIVKPYDPTDLLVKIEGRLLRQKAIADAHIESLSQLKRQILTILNHEFRTPLTFVVAYSDMLNNADANGLNETDVLSYLKGVSAGADRLRNLIENFILLVEMETGDAQKTFEWRRCPIYSLDDLFSAARARVKALQDGTYPLIIQIAGDVPVFVGDAEYLTIAIGHLLSNAVKFSPPGKPITLGADASDSHIHIWVRDEGRGIPAAELEHIWEVFYQVDRTQYEDQGAGAGLAIVRGVAQLHNGMVNVTSVVGEGSTFTISLPIEKPVV
ncbi:MAG: response regulator [Chloroflexi bacterium]|nr:response regulator [Chloroflexota bacterium]